MKRLTALLVLGIAIAPASAGAIELKLFDEPLRLDITESLFAAYHGNLGVDDGTANPPGLIVERDKTGTHPENHFYDILNRLNVDLSWRRFRLATRWDTAVFFDTPAGSCGPPATTMATLRSRFCENYFYPEKLSLEYAGRGVEVTLGDFYVVFGRGLVLSLRKLDELGIDTTLLGGKMIYHEGNLAATLVAGATNVQDIDESTGRSPSSAYGPAADPYDMIAGGRVEYRAFDKVIVGVHEVGGVQRRNATVAPHLNPDSMFMYGGSLDAPRLTDWLALYFEAAGQRMTLSDVRQDGYAIYGAATGYFGPVSVLIEVKDYSNFQRWKSSIDPSLPEFAPVVYNQPPTAERVQTELVSPIYDVVGPRARVDWRVNPSLLLYASYAWFLDHAAEGGLVYHDPYGGAEIRWNEGRSHLFPSGGYRIERCAPESMTCAMEAPDGEFQHIGHVEWDAAQALPHGLSIESQGFALFRRGDHVINPDGTPASWTEGDAYLSLKWTPYLMVTGGFEWSTRPATTLNQYYYNGTIQWNITTASSILLFVGGERGGLKCISGICRNFPAFTGARLEVVLRL